MTKGEYSDKVVEQGVYLYEHEPWVRTKVDSLETMDDKSRFLTAAAVYALAKVGIDMPE